jgi:hypothetical protein
MSGTVSTRFYFPDWLSDPGLRASSLAARGLWMDLLCYAGANKGKDHGFVSLNGRKLTEVEIARMTNCSTEVEVFTLLQELELNGVFSRDRRGIIYCRRMVRAEKSRSNGRLGGNPNLLKAKGNKNQVQPEPNPHIPEPVPEPIPKKESAGSDKPTRADDYPPNAFEIFWRYYPPGRKTGKGAAQRKFDTIRKRGDVTFTKLMLGLKHYVDSQPEPQFTKAPEVWLNKGCWDDEHIRRHETVGNGNSKIGFSGLAARLRRSIAERNAFEQASFGIDAIDIEPADGHRDTAASVERLETGFRK